MEKIAYLCIRMTYDLQTLLLIEVDTLAVLANLVCGVLIWRSRHEVADRSRIILFLLVLTALPLIGKVLSLMTHGLNNRFVEVLPIIPTLMGLITVLLMLLYAVEVMRPNWLKWRHCLLLFLPLAVVFVLSVLFMGQFTVLHSTAEVWQHIGEPNVLLRLLINLMALFCCLTLLWLPYKWQESSASRRWIITYVCFIFLIGVLFHTWTLTLSMPVHILHNLAPTLFIVYYTWYELHERFIPVPMERAEKLTPPNPAISVAVAGSDDLWQRIVKLIHEDDLWRNPDLNLEMLCQQLGSNKDYVLRCFRQNADTTFLDYVNSLRIGYVTDELRRNPLQSQRDLFFNAGFRSKTTAYRNFCKYNGQSPSEFIASLSADNQLTVSE
ncbi:MAG: helix-turn-helix domain-containing protein [Prevotella sp.]|nr:helix-turn-helix domain-containing protein [Prevotella sp.]